MLVTGLKGLKVVDVSCGSGDAQTLSVTENGKFILFFATTHVCSIFKSINNTFSILFWKDVSFIAGNVLSLGQVWSWGDGDYGKLGRGGSDGCKTPKLIEKLQDLDIVKVRCGSQFSVAITKDGQVYSWGKGDNQRLGHGTEEHVRYPKLLGGLQGNNKKRVSCCMSLISTHCKLCSLSMFAWDRKGSVSCKIPTVKPTTSCCM